MNPKHAPMCGCRAPVAPGFLACDSCEDARDRTPHAHARLLCFCAGLLLGLLLICLSGCAARYSFETAVGANVTKQIHGYDGGFAGGTEVVRLSLRSDFDERRFCAYTHLSHFFRGRPFNDRAEDYVDAIECGLKFQIGGGR